MNILAAIKREEKKLEKQMSKLQHRLNGIRSAAQALGHSAVVEVKGAKKRVLSAAGRFYIDGPGPFMANLGSNVDSTTFVNNFTAHFCSKVVPTACYTKQW